LITVAIFDLDKVLQEPAYPHNPDLLQDIASVLGVSFGFLFAHYSTSFTTNEDEEKHHLSLCVNEEQREKVRGFWRKLYDNMAKATIIPGARDLLLEAVSRGWEIFAWTKGSVEIQHGRLESIGLSEFFPKERIIYSPRKGTVGGFQEDLLPLLPEGQKIVIGDSFAQDISPPLQVGGFTCIWIRWDQNPPENADLDNPNLIVVESTQELATKVKEGLLDDVQNTHQ